MNENDNWVESIGMAECELDDNCLALLGAYFHKKQVGCLDIAGNKFSFKAMTKLMDELLMSAESGRLKALDISDSIFEDKPN